MFAIGDLLDLTQPWIPSRGLRYYLLSRASLCLDPVLESPTVTGLQAMVPALATSAVLNRLINDLAFGGDISHVVSWSERTGACVGAVRDQYEISIYSQPSSVLPNGARLTLTCSLAFVSAVAILLRVSHILLLRART